MHEWVEIEGRSKEDAIERACNALNTTLSYLFYEVIGRNGAKIRARKVEKGEDAPTRPESAVAAAPPPPARREEENDDAIAEEIEERHETETPSPTVEPTDVGRKAQEVLGEILRHIDEAKVELRERENEVELDIVSNGSGLLIGKRGQTLEALQHLVAKICGLDRREGKRLVIDSEGYRARRREALEGLARKLASRVRRERRPMSVEPMNATDRRILHLALQDDPDVATKSVGEGRDRKVMIVPKGQRDRADRGPRGDRGSAPPRSSNNRGGSRNRHRGGGGPGLYRQEATENFARRPKAARQHDSFDTPAEPNLEMHEDPDAPLIEDVDVTEPEARLPRDESEE